MITLTYLLKMCDNTVQKAVKAHWNSPLQHMSIKMILAFPAVYVTQLLGSWNFTSQSRFIFKSVKISKDQSELETLIDIVGFFWRGGGDFLIYYLMQLTALLLLFCEDCPPTLMCFLSKILCMNLGTECLWLITILSYSSWKRAFVRKWKIWGKIRKF